MNNFKIVKNNDWKEVEFNGEITDIPLIWEVNKLENIYKIVGGGTPPTINSEYWNGSIPWLGPKEMSRNKNCYIGIGEKNISELGAKKLGNKKVLKGSVILSTRAPIGYVNLANNDLFTNQGCHSFLPNENINNIFFYYWLKKNTRILEKNASGTTFKELGSSKLKEIEIQFPPLSQQLSIATVLSKQEQIISDMETLITKLESRFTYLSDVLLSGKIRVKEVDGKTVLYKNTEWKEVEVNGEMKDIPSDWELDNLGSINIPLIKTGVKLYTGNLPFYATGEVENFNLALQPTGLFSYATKPSRANLEVYDNSIYFARMKNTLKILNFSKKEDILLSTGFLGLQPNANYIDRLYIYNLIQASSFQEIKNQNCKGSTQESLSDSAAKSIQIMIPILKEQILIGLSLKKLTDLINQHKKYLSKEKEKFEWLLDNLLSGNYLIKERE